MNPTVKTGLTFVLGGVCGAVGSRIISWRFDPPQLGPDGRPIRPPGPREAMAKKNSSAPSPSPPPTETTAAAK